LTGTEEESFTPDTRPPGAEASPIAKAEEGMFAQSQPAPNTFVLALGRRGHISWHSESSTAVLGLIVLVILCLLVLVLGVIALCVSDKSWLPVLVQALGTAIVGVSGAIVGASATGSRRKR
jgi:hypothetical protein